MKLSTHTYPLSHLGYEGAIRAIAEAGFDAYDFSMFGMSDPQDPLRQDDWRERIQKVRKYADSIGIVCNQSHAPFPSHRDDDDDWNAQIGGWLIRALEITSILGGKVCVVHPWNNFTPQENVERVYLPLLPYCKKFGVRIGVENMWNWGERGAVPCACSLPDNFNAHLAPLDPEWFVACLDIGHAEMFSGQTSAVELIKALGPRLHALHVHDNDRYHDDHAFPFTGKVDWAQVLVALRDIGYDDDLTFEVGINHVPTELQSEGLRYLAEIGKYMIKKIGD